MPFFRKKPVVIEARKWPDIRHSPEAYQEAVDVAEWIGHTQCAIDNTEMYETPCLLIPTLEGVMKAMPGDWIIKGVEGEFYPCKPDIFEATYEEVNNDND
jgi:hypothetical protein